MSEQIATELQEGTTVTFGDNAVTIHDISEGKYKQVMFDAVCPKCQRLVKVDEGVLSNILDNDWATMPTKKRQFNATCRDHGRVKMLFWISSFDWDKDKEN